MALCLMILEAVRSGMGAVYVASMKALWKWRRTTGLPFLVRNFIRIGDYFYVYGAMMLTLVSITTQKTFTLACNFDSVTNPETYGYFIGCVALH